MHNFVLYDISDNMYAIFHDGKYVTINTADITKIGYYVVKFLSELYTLQDEKKVDKKFIKVSKFIVKPVYLSIVKSNTKKLELKRVSS